MTANFNLQQLSDRAEVQDTIERLDWCFDRRDWDGLRDVVAEHILVDYTAAYGGEATTVSADDQIAAWRTMLEAVSATQHVITGFQIHLDGDRATVTANELGWLVRNGAGEPPLTRFGATLDLRLARTAQGWRINALTAHPAWIDGDISVPQT